MQRRDLLKLAMASPALMALGGCQPEQDEALLTLEPESTPYQGIVKKSASDALFSVPNEQALNILVLGDSGTGTAKQWAACDAIKAFHETHPLDLVLHVGDVIYSHPDPNPDHLSYITKFESPYAFLKNTNKQDSVPFYAWPGNHDHKEGGLSGLLKYAARHDTLLRMPSTYYSVNTHSTLGLGPDKPEVEVVGIDTYKMVKNGTYLDQLAFLDKQLARSQAKYKLVVGHHPLRSNGKHGSAEPVVDLLKALFEQHGVFAYLAGHEHALELMAAENGVNYIVSGGGGGGIRTTHVRNNTRFAAANHGAFVLRVTSDEVHAIPVLTGDFSDWDLAYPLT